MALEYYKTRTEAENKRKPGERIYYSPGLGYFIVQRRKRDFWDKLLN